MRKGLTTKGQTLAEFALAAPLLFFLFFVVLQTAYSGYTALAVQRAALAAAREASLTGPDDNRAFMSQLTLSLLPLVRLNRQTLLTIPATVFHLKPSRDGKTITAQVRYPMPLWIPLVRTIFGEPLQVSPGLSVSPEAGAVGKILAQAGLPSLPPVPPQGLFIRWVTLEASTFNEAYRGK